MKKIIGLALTCLAFAVLSACGDNKHGDEKPIARAFEEYLYFSDIKHVVPQETSPEDSARIVSAEIKNWMQTQALVHRARLNLPAEKQRFERLVEDYENSLFIYAYEREIIKQKLDLEIPATEILSYYQDNIDQFVLSKDAVRLNYAVFDSATFKQVEVKKMFNRDHPDAVEELQDYCLHFAKEYAVEDSSSWMYKDEVMTRFPISSLMLDRLYRNYWSQVFYANGQAYILRYREQLKAGSTAPLNLVENPITQRLLVKKRKGLLEQLRHDIFNEGLNKKELEILNPHEE